jgi:IclR family transcriptional regulator, KDG regulon repressor
MPRVTSSANLSDGVLAITLTFSIVEALARSRSGLGVTELAKQVDATKSRVHRHLVTLLQRGYVTRDPQTEKYCVGPAMVVLAQEIISGVDLVAIARPVLARLRDDFGHTALIARCEGERIRVLDVALGNSDFAIVQRTGNVLGPDMLHCSALGKIALAFGPRELLQNLLSRRVPKVTPKTITDPRGLRAELDRVRKRGWASVPDEGMLGFNAFAAPISDARRDLVAMIGVIGATRILPADPLPDFIIGLQRAGSQIAAALGGSCAIPTFVPPSAKRQEKAERLPR